MNCLNCKQPQKRFTKNPITKKQSQICAACKDKLKVCISCKKEFSVFCFGKKTNRLHFYCRKCKSVKDSKYRKKNLEKITKKTKINQKIYRDKKREFIYNYLLNNSCVLCNEEDVRCLQFDHLKDKKHNISNMYSYSIKTIKKEIAKCRVLCANCHAKRTSDQFGHFKSRKILGEI